MVVIAAAIAMQMGIVAVVAGVGGGVSAAKGSPNPPITCTVSATVAFAAPGISNAGSVSTKDSSTTTTTTTTTTSDETLGGSGCTGSGTNLKIKSASTLCTGSGEPSSNSACFTGKKKEYGYNSWNNYENTGVSSLSSLKDLKFTINSIKYEIKDLSGSAIGCAGGEVGFGISGTVSAPSADKGQSAVLNACLGSVNGTGLSDYSNFAGNIGGAGTVATAQVNPGTSTIAIDGGS
jgi:hypothetical protein